MIGRLLSEYSFRKRKQEILALHKENIKNGHLIQIEIKNVNVKKQFVGIFKNSFGFIIKFMERKIYSSPAAIILLPNTIEDYLKIIGPKLRKMIRKAEKSGYVPESFIWNDCLDDIYAIHTSSKTRQGKANGQKLQGLP
jgi:hypothetical protein